MYTLDSMEIRAVALIWAAKVCLKFLVRATSGCFWQGGGGWTPEDVGNGLNLHHGFNENQT